MKKKNIVIGFICAIVLCTTAYAKTETVYLAVNQMWGERPAVTRSGAYSYAEARCNAVFPTNGGTDNMRYIQTHITTTGGLNLTDVYTLDETTASDTQMFIKDGYLNEKTIVFAFRGNTSQSATANVSYDPL